MLPRSHRFSFKKGAPKRVYATPFFVLRYDPSNDNSLHLGIVVGKKVDKKAVARNLLKRRISTTIEELLPKTQPINLVVFAKKQINTLTKDELNKELKEAFNSKQLFSWI